MLNGACGHPPNYTPFVARLPLFLVVLRFTGGDQQCGLFRRFLGLRRNSSPPRHPRARWMMDQNRPLVRGAVLENQASGLPPYADAATRPTHLNSMP